MSIILIIILLAILAVVYRFFIKPYLLCRFYRKQGCHMKFFPLIGYLLEDLRNVKEKGDLLYRLKNLDPKMREMKAVGGNFFSEVHLILTDPSLAKEVATKDIQNYNKAAQFIESIRLITNGITLTEGDEWKKRRKLDTSALHYEFLRDMIPETFKIIKEFTDMMALKSGTSVMIMDEFKMITGDVIGRIFIGEKFANIQFKGQNLTRFVSILSSRMNDPNFLTPLYYIFGANFLKLGILPSHKKHMEEIHDFKQLMLQIIDKRMKEFKDHGLSTEPHRKSLIEIFYEQRVKHPEEALTDEEILGEVLVFYMAGMDTTGSLSSMATYYASIHPEYKIRLEVEIKELLSAEVTLDRLNKMEFTTAFLKETLRMSLPGPSNLPRVAVKDHELGHLKIKKGTMIFVSFFSNMFDPDNFENPNEFNPDRWITGKAKTAVEKNPYLFTPFWAGQRNCIGQHLAMAEAKMILSLFISNFEFSLPQDYKLRFTFKSLYEPEDPVAFKITKK